MRSRDLKRDSERNGGEAQSRNKAFNFLFEAKNIETAILLLQSKENTTLLAAIEALSKYANESKDNIKVLFDLGIINSVLPIIKHEDLFIKRFAAKLLVQMIVLPDMATYLIKSDHLLYFVNQLTSEKDTFMQEYFSAILAKLTKDSYGAALLAKYCPDMNFLFEKMQSPDPDVKKNSVEILYNLMQDPVCSQKISESEKLDFSSLYEHFASSYPEIQSFALNTVAEIIGRNKDKDVQSLFRKTNGVKILLNFLDNDEWNELHTEALKILNLAAENPAIASDLIDIGGVPQILNYMEHAINPKLFVEALKIIVHIANIPNGRKILHSHEIVEYLIDALQRPESDVIEISCYGIGKMTLYNPVAKEFASKKLVEIILGFLKKEDLRWSARHAACFALKQLLINDSKNCDVFLKIHGQDYLLQITKSEQIPLETCITVLETLIVIARHPTYRNILINLDTVNIICLLLKPTYPLADELKIVCCNLLSVLSLEKDGRFYFLKAKGPERLYTLITDAHSIPVRNAAVRLIQTISTDLVTASAFVESKYLSYMLNNRSSARIIPSWDTCIETLFKSHLSAKFAFTGRLSLHDLTLNGFYVLRRNVCPFPVLDDIFRFKFCPLEPVYVINFAETTTWNSLQSEAVIESNMEARNSIKRNIAAKEIFLSAENKNAWFELKFGRLQHDPYLIEYVRLFKSMLLATEPEEVTRADVRSTNIQFVSSRAKMLARFVARQMSGLNPSDRCVEHQLEIHLKEIKERLETSVIPLGRLRVGCYLERALLFKAIADKICLPAALVRGEYGISWIEIAVPQIEDSTKEKSFEAYSDEDHEHSKIIKTSHKSLNKSDINSRSNEHKGEQISFPRNHRSMIYPVKLMKPNFIVDLMDIPGDLIPIGSPRSRLYCATKLTCDKICCH